uniref:1,6-anhydro-N-acetylmuramyl-L-alanine amidase AmpD n=1 Tax=Magnetococcus massalia (strain MO-1) TaxID=451514 RepID=A0A1S7LQD3_MAGMO|nr:1,6-anhydro-N-acetylmuramyl-L-alanine amidase AmpD [Candidatus Magnetococcus massalia]
MIAMFRLAPSPHHDERPADCPPELVVIHAISLPPGQFGGPWIDQLFQGTLKAEDDPFFAEICQLRVAAHFLIRRDGEVVQYVPVNRRAWHAGQSSWQGRERCNDFSIGIELEGDEEQPFEPVQYRQLARLIKQLQQQLPSLPADAITSHQAIAPGRKWDPGKQFDWDLFYQQLRRAEAGSWPIQLA